MPHASYLLPPTSSLVPRPSLVVCYNGAMDTHPAPHVTICGTGSWGTTLAIICAEAGARVTLLAPDADEADRLRADGENRRFLPGYPFPPRVAITSNIA